MLFCCDVCDCVDDTDLAHPDAVVLPVGVFKCSRCRDTVDAEGVVYSGEWHGSFPREQYDPKVDVVCNRANGIGLS